MSGVFTRGRMRLYLLKLLDEHPRHGYEILQLLEARLAGTWRPSPGSIYPRLRRLEDDGLVTHTERGGRKVYSLTPAGQAEITERADEIAALEKDIRESVAALTDEVGSDASTLIRDIGGELERAARELRRGHGRRWKQPRRGRPAGLSPAGAPSPAVTLDTSLDELTTRVLALTARSAPRSDQVERCAAVLDAAYRQIAEILVGG